MANLKSIALAIWNSDTPSWLPSPEDVVVECMKRNRGPSTLTFHAPSGRQVDAALIKWGPMLAMSEARTQDFLAKQVNGDSDSNSVVRVPIVYFAFRHNGIGYIVMQHVGIRDCDKGDFLKIALAVERLERIPSPRQVAGPFGGGAIMYRFFAYGMSSVPYGSVELLEQQINSILIRRGYKSRVDFPEKAGGSLSICIDDLHWGNFRIDSNGCIFSVDHARTNFLPLAFRNYSLRAGGKELALMLKKPLSEDEGRLLGAMRIANGEIEVPLDSSIALPKSLRHLKTTFPLFD